MAESISNLSISVALDGNKVESGFNRIGAKVEQFAEGMKKATAFGAAFGSFLGNASFAAVSGTFDRISSAVDRVGKSVIGATMAVEKTNFQQLLEKGISGEQLVKGDAFKNSLTGSLAYLGEAWENLLANVGGRFSPVIAKIVEQLTGVVNWTSQFITDIAETLSGIMPENFVNLEKIFMNIRIISIDIAKNLVSAVAKLAKFASDARLLGNKTAVKETLDDARGWFTNTFPNLAKSMGPLSGFFLPDKERDKIRNRRLDQARENGDIEGINQIIQDGKNIDNLFGNILLKLEKVDFTKRIPDVQKIKDLSGLKFDDPRPVDSIFAAALQRGSQAEWESRMRDRFGGGPSQLEVLGGIRDEAVEQKELLKNIDMKIGSLNPVIMPGALEFGSC